MTVDKSPFFGDDIYTLGDEIIVNQDFIIKDNIKKTDIDVKTPYINFMVKQFKHLKNFPQKIVIDAGNGVADTVITDIFDALAFDLVDTSSLNIVTLVMMMPSMQRSECWN